MSKFQMIMEMVDKTTTPISKMTSAVEQSRTQIEATQKQIAKLNAQGADIDGFKALKRQGVETSQSLRQAKTRLAALTEEVNRTEKPNRKLTAQLKKAQKEVEGLTKRQAKESEQLKIIQGRLKGAGIETHQLAEANRRVAQSTAQMNDRLSQQRKTLDDVAARQAHLTKLRERDQKIQGKILEDSAKIGASVYGVKQLVDAYGQVTSAQGEIASLGIDEQGIAQITQAAESFSNEWAGTTTDNFIKASYDIKSGISSLSNAVVGEFTKIAALTGVATKSSTEQMTSLFATGYGIYRSQFNQFGAATIEGWEQLSNAEKDMKFGEYFSAGIATSVQAFKTDGAQMSAAISSLGAKATSSNVSLAEQLSILGELQTTMPGAEAATKYKAFLGSVTVAGEKLQLSFLNAQNQVRSMPEVLTELKNKYGETLDDIEKKEIKDAFGSDEAVALIDLLYPKIDQVKDAMSTLDNALQGGMGKTLEMAEKIGKGGASESFTILSQRTFNTAAAIGEVFAPTMIMIADILGQAAMAITTFTREFPIITELIAYAITAFIAFKTVLIAKNIAVLAYSKSWEFATTRLTLHNFAVLKSNILMTLNTAKMVTATAAQWTYAAAQSGLLKALRLATLAQTAFNFALRANPIGLVITAIGALVGIAMTLFDGWSPLANFFSGLWEGIKGGAVKLWETFKTIFAWSPIGLMMNAWKPLWNFISGFFQSIKGGFSEMVDYLINALLAPFEFFKKAFQSLSSLFSDQDVKATQTIEHVAKVKPLPVQTDAPGMNTQPAQAMKPLMAPGPKRSLNVTNQYGDLHVHPSPGMDEEALARHVDERLTQRDEQAARETRALAFDTPTAW